MSKRRGRYVAVYGDWYRHPKVSGDTHPDTGKAYDRLSLAARGLWVSLLSRSGDGRLDGEATLKSAQSAAPGVPDKQLRTLLAELERNDLVSEGKLVNYSECNLTRSEDEANKAEDATRKATKRREDAERESASRPPDVRPDKPRTATGKPPDGPPDSLTQDSGLRTQDPERSLSAAKPGSARRWSALAELARSLVDAACKDRKVGPPQQVSYPDHQDWVEIAKWAERTEALRPDVAAEFAINFAVLEWLNSDAPGAGYNPHWFSTNPNPYFLADAIEERERRKRRASA